MEKLSIVIPAYNAQEFLDRTIKSALDTKGVVPEVVVVDDGSTDLTSAICRCFGSSIRAERITNGGVSRARNIGAELASGEWLLFLDSDDILEPDGPAFLIRAANESHASFAYGLIRERQQPPLPPRTTGQNYAAGLPPQPALHNYWRCAVITPGSAVVRREVHERIGGFIPGYEPMEDRDYWVKAGLVSSCAHVDRVVLDKTWRPISAGKMDARRIWNGLRSRLALPDYCREKRISWPPDLPRDSRTLFEKAVKEALWFRCWELVGALCRECRERKLATFWTLRAELEFLLRGGERRYPAPEWLLPLAA